MKVTVIVDNKPHSNNHELKTEHGLSLHIEYNSYSILCDLGASNVFADNAKILGIDISTCNFTFISHGHNDHCGGLSHFFKNTKEQKVYIHSSIPDEEYFSTRREKIHNLNIDRRTFIDNEERLIKLDETAEIAEGVYAVQCHEDRYPTPYGNCFLWKNSGKKEENDSFKHELSLAFITPKGVVVISPCSHCGALNIMQECKRVTGCDRIYAYIGGLHFVEGENCITETTDFTDAIRKEYPETLIFTGHCTCETAKNIIAEKNNNATMFSIGTIIEL